MQTRADANLILIGLRGSGKSTIARLLADALARPLVDLDQHTLRVLGVSSAAEAFRTVGQPAFRTAEMLALDLVMEDPAQVIALGGGTPTAPGAAERLRHERSTGAAWIVYLHAPPEELAARIAGEDLVNRPALLLGSDPVGEVPRVYAARDPLYRELADVVVEVAGISPGEAASRAAGAFRALG